MIEVPVIGNFLYYLPSINCVEAPKDFKWRSVTDVSYARFVTDAFIKDTDGKGKIAFLLEPFSLHPEDYLSAMKKPFDAVLTHNRYFVEQFDWLWYPKGGSWIALKFWRAWQKTHNVSMLLSEKKSTKGQKFRHEIYKSFPDKLDMYGLDKWVYPSQALFPFRYSVVVENEKSNGWFTERLIDCFATGTIPIYWGCPEIGNYFNTQGMILVDTLEDVKEALELASEKHYELCKKAIAENLELAKQYRVTEDWIFERYPFLFEGI